VVAAHCPYFLRSLWSVSGATFGVRRRPCLVDYNGSHLARPTAPSHGGAVTFLGYSQAVAVSPRQFPRKRRMDQPDSKIPEGLLGASGCGARASSAWLRHETLPGVEVSGRIRSGDVSMLYWEQRDGVHWACLGVGSNGDLVWLGLSSLTLVMACMSSGHSRHRVAGLGRGARGLALQEIRWDAFWPLVAFFLWRRGCLRGRVSSGRLFLGEIRAIGWPAMDAFSGVLVLWEKCPRGRVSFGRLFSGEIFSAGP
jgi:hypothetical protein